MLTDGNGHYIKHDQASGKYIPVASVKDGSVWDDRGKANKVLKNSLEKVLKKRYMIAIKEIDEPVIVEQKHLEQTVDQARCELLKSYYLSKHPAAGNENPANGKELPKKVAPKVKLSIDRSLLEYVRDRAGIEKIQQRVDEITRFTGYVQSRNDFLRGELSKIDREITDIHHFIEFKKLNAYQGWIVYKLLQKKLLKRREIKDEMLILSNLSGCYLTPESLGNIEKSIIGLEDRIYKPRELAELFT